MHEYLGSKMESGFDLNLTILSSMIESFIHLETLQFGWVILYFQIGSLKLFCWVGVTADEVVHVHSNLDNSKS